MVSDFQRSGSSELIVSKDGTSIFFHKTGNGPPLVLVHGTGASSARWKPVLPALEKHRTVYAVDRRGHGRSLREGPYDLAREFEDIAALIDSLPAPVDVVAHSFGALCTLEAALLAKNIRRLVLYEPPLPVEGHAIYSSADVAKLEALNAAGDREGILEAFFRGYVRVPEREFQLLRAAPAWASRLASAHSIPREIRAHEAYRFRPERFTSLKIPMLLLLGGDSPPFFAAALDLVRSALPHARLAVLPGQRHVAMDTAPDLFTKAVLEFLEEA